MLPLTKEKISKHLGEIRGTVRREVHPIPRFKFFEGECPGAERPDFDDSAWQDFEVGDSWGGYDKVAWFRATVEIPEGLREQKLALRFLVGPRDGGDSTAETMLYANGRPLQGIDVWHEAAWLPPELVQAGKLAIALKAWSGVLGVLEQRRFKVAELVWIDERAEGFFYLADTLRKALSELKEEDWRYVQLLRGLNDAFKRIDFSKPRSEGYYASLGEALEFLQARVESWQELEPQKPTVIGVGHAHIDLAWLWRLAHSREKAARTFATALHLMRQYPEYHFLHSSPQLYKFLEQDYPEIFAQVREKIEAGQWEVTGGMWVESDVNLPAGESLIRQLIFGRRYIRETFGLETPLLWLPDVFGYSGALPQILKKSGIEYFMTTKISWSQFNRFPYDTFHWRGIDGTEVLTHFITTPEEHAPFYTYNGQLAPREVKGLYESYQQKTINDELLMAFGWGDGGGGPTQEMLESARVLKNVPGLPKVALGKAEPFFERLQERLAHEEAPVWDGELYLEYHRGTYTSQAWLKRANRKAERLYHEAEWLASVVEVLTGEARYPDLTEGWELLLLNQFHDILPGSSIREVYEDAAADFEKIDATGQAALAEAEKRILDGVRLEQESMLVFNAFAQARGGLVELPTEGLGGKTLVSAKGEPLPSQQVQGGKPRLLVHVPEAPSLGYIAYPLTEGGAHEGDVNPLQISKERIEAPFYSLMLSDSGQITSLYDKEGAREVIAGGEPGNAFQVFEDKPLAFDAWDIDIFYQEKMQEILDLTEAEVEEQGPLRGVLRLSWRFYDSTVTQRLIVYAHSRRIDFETKVDWQESQTLLKVAFPTTVRATRATYDIQFGNLERPTYWNTSWDWARFEVVGHKWADLSEGNYGVALLNDCKYGYDVKDHVMRLTLIKSSILPDAKADKGRHLFTYSLLPHAGSWRESEVIPEGYALNTPLRAARAPANPNGALPSSFAFAEVDKDNIIIETVKRAEDGDGWVVRLYETKQHREYEVTLHFGRPLKRALECNLVEEELVSVPFEGDRLTFSMRPYEIKTFRVWF